MIEQGVTPQYDKKLIKLKTLQKSITLAIKGSRIKSIKQVNNCLSTVSATKGMIICQSFQAKSTVTSN